MTIQYVYVHVSTLQNVFPHCMHVLYVRVYIVKCMSDGLPNVRSLTVT